ncbi:MAG: hypothetical protein JWO31_2873 [Phycisphaerales bacterium]|nr:hypothetical protein [Phycisphaerales bacterium]
MSTLGLGGCVNESSVFAARAALANHILLMEYNKCWSGTHEPNAVDSPHRSRIAPMASGQGQSLEPQ